MKGSTKCQCGCGMDITKELRFILESIDREMVKRTGKEIEISSGARCEKHNRQIGGAGNSAHIKGIAADILTPDTVTTWHLWQCVVSRGIKRIGDAPGRFLHVDIGKPPEYAQKVVWKY